MPERRPDRMSDRMSERMPDRLSETLPDKMLKECQGAEGNADDLLIFEVGFSENTDQP